MSAKAGLATAQSATETSSNDILDRAITTPRFVNRLHEGRILAQFVVRRILQEKHDNHYKSITCKIHLRSFLGFRLRRVDQRPVHERLAAPAGRTATIWFRRSADIAGPVLMGLLGLALAAAPARAAA